MLKNMANKKKNMMLGGDDVVANVGYSNSGLVEKQEEPEYPYCLRLYLGKEELEKLGINEIPKLGEEMMMLAKIKVVGTRMDQQLGNTMEVQIVEMDIQNAKKEEKKPQDVLYSENKIEV